MIANGVQYNPPIIFYMINCFLIYIFWYFVYLSSSIYICMSFSIKKQRFRIRHGSVACGSELTNSYFFYRSNYTWKRRKNSFLLELVPDIPKVWVQACMKSTDVSATVQTLKFIRGIDESYCEVPEKPQRERIYFISCGLSWSQVIKMVVVMVFSEVSAGLYCKDCFCSKNRK